MDDFDQDQQRRQRAESDDYDRRKKREEESRRRLTLAQAAKMVALAPFKLVGALLRGLGRLLAGRPPIVIQQAQDQRKDADVAKSKREDEDRRASSEAAKRADAAAPIQQATSQRPTRMGAAVAQAQQQRDERQERQQAELAKTAAKAAASAAVISGVPGSAAAKPAVDHVAGKVVDGVADRLAQESQQQRAQVEAGQAMDKERAAQREESPATPSAAKSEAQQAEARAQTQKAILADATPTMKGLPGVAWANLPGVKGIGGVVAGQHRSAANQPQQHRRPGHRPA